MARLQACTSIGSFTFDTYWVAKKHVLSIKLSRILFFRSVVPPGGADRSVHFMCLHPGGVGHINLARMDAPRLCSTQWVHIHTARAMQSQVVGPVAVKPEPGNSIQQPRESESCDTLHCHHCKACSCDWRRPQSFILRFPQHNTSSLPLP